MSALLEAPSNHSEPHGPVHETGDGAITDHKLVARVRRGDDRAFEALYERYHRRIHAYVFGMVKDHQRAEDVTQEVFVSALRRMRATERPIAFKPWIYEIAKNACIDQFRRSKRAEEVSFDADEGLAPSDYGRLVSREPVPDVALAAKQQLDHLCGAFGGLSDAHHEILVLRELEGLSYREIGERMGMSRPAVESTLFRARRRLTEEYDELASGQRCQRIQSIIATAGSGRLGARDTRRLARHVAHCQPCRRQALAAGVDSALVARPPLRQRAIEKVAALFPIPLLFRGRRGGSGESWMGQLPVMSDHAAAGGAKLAAVAALVVAGLGAGVSTQVSSGGEDRAADRPVRAERKAPAKAADTGSAPLSGSVTSSRSASDAGDRRDATRTSGTSRGSREGAQQRRSSAPAKGVSNAPAATQDTGGGSTGDPVDTSPVGSSVPEQAPDASTPQARTPGSGGVDVQVPVLDGPATTLPQRSVEVVAIHGAGTLQDTVTSVQGVGQALEDATTQVTGNVDEVTSALGAAGG